MKITAFISCILSLTAFTALAAPRIVISLDQKDALYQCGEQATFKITVQDDKSKTLLNSGSLTAVLTNDGRKKIEHQTFDLQKQNPIIIKNTLREPGFLRLQAIFTQPDSKQKYISKIYGAGFEPEKITAAVPAPDDFMKFWTKAIADAEKIPLDLQMEKLEKYSDGKHTSYKLSVAAPGGRVFGFLCIPNVDRKHPLLVTVPGAGPGYGAPSVRNDIASLTMNVHAYDPMIPGKSVSESYKQLNKSLTYMYHGAPNPTKLYYYRAILGIHRMLNHVVSRSDIDPERVAYHGSSQGGAFGFILGGLYGKFKAVVCNVPAMCDHLGYKKGRNPGWPFYGSTLKYSREIEAMVPYYDAASFARNIQAPVRVIVGFADTTCSPSSVYAAYNGIPSADKKITNEIGMGHACRPSYFQGIRWAVEIIQK